jgi:predicted PhzF superfamily epimerase YddE/YHI9
LIEVRVLRVFTDELGRHGNLLGVVLDSTGLTDESRQSIATRLGYSETVFIEDIESARLRLFTPASELPFAGHPLVGVSWLLARETGRQPAALYPSLLQYSVPTFVENGLTWIRGHAGDTPPWELVQLASAEDVAAQKPPRRGNMWQKAQIWAWADEPEGIIRARVFALDYGVIEDEACGSATMLLAARLRQPILVRHGQGSLIWARPAGTGAAEVGGHVVYDSRTSIDPTIPVSAGRSPDL